MYNGGFHHSKIMMVDDIFCTVGTANLNSRSLRYDYETNAFIFNKEITGELNENVSERYRTLYAANTGILEKSAHRGRSSSDGLPIYSRHFVILHRTNLLENYSL